MADIQQKSRSRKLIPLKYSCEEVYERMENGLCIFCEEKDSPEHQKLKHKGIQIVCVEDDQMPEAEEISLPKTIDIFPVEPLHTPCVGVNINEISEMLPKQQGIQIGIDEEDRISEIKEEDLEVRMDEGRQKLANDNGKNDACQVFDKMSLNAQPHESDPSSVIMPGAPPIPLQPPDPPDFSNPDPKPTQTTPPKSTTINVNGSLSKGVNNSVTTNLFALYALSSHSQANSPFNHHSNNISLVSQHLSLILKEIDSSQRKLAQMEKQMLGYESIDISRPNIVPELKLFLQRNQLPLGKDSRTGITEMVSSVGHSCEKSADLLSQYMSYKVLDRCPDDWSFGQKLILRAGEPLPRRRCLAKTVQKKDLTRFPDSLWRTVSNKSINWSGLGCKSFDCLKGKKISQDCVGCFDLGNEKDRFVKVKGKNDFLVDECVARFFEELDYINQRSVRETRFNDDAGDVSSMEIAELAGDLLDVKWSTYIYIWMSMKGGIEKGSLQMLVDSNSILETPLVTSPTLRFADIDENSSTFPDDVLKVGFRIADVLVKIGSDVYEVILVELESKRKRKAELANPNRSQIPKDMRIRNNENGKEGMIVVFDPGGGKFDIHILELLEIFNEVFKVRSKHCVAAEALADENQDKEVKDCAITGMGLVISTFGYQLRKDLSLYFNVFVDQMGNKITSFAAARAITDLDGVTSRELTPAITVLQLFLSSSNPVLRFAAVRILNKVAMSHPRAVTNCNIDMESLISDHNRSIATLAITTLLKTGNESSVERLMKQITNFISDIADEFKISFVNPITPVRLADPHKVKGDYKLEAEFIKEAAKENMMQFEGHRSVGEFSEYHGQSAAYCVSSELIKHVKMVFTVLMLWKEEPPDNIIL